MPIILPEPLAIDCRGKIHPKAIEGFKLFNQGEYWLAHEALESAWLEETGQIRHLYRGILQVGVTYYHIECGNYIGALKVYSRSLRWLNPFPDTCRGIDLRQFRSDLERVIQELQKLGQEKISEFDRSLFRPICWN